MIGGMEEVVSAVIVRDGRILLTQRRPEKSFPFTWECPGGKVEGSESHHAALQRELIEELGGDFISTIAPGALWCGTIKREGLCDVFLLMYYVEVQGQLAPQEGQGFGWFMSDEMSQLKLTPGNAMALSTLCTFLARNSRWGSTIKASK